MSNENDKGLGPIETPVPGEDALLPPAMKAPSLAESKQRTADAKAAIGAALAGDQDKPAPTKKSRKKLVIGLVAGVAAVALTAGGVTFGAAQTRISNYTNAVEDQTAAIAETAKAETDLTAADKALAEATAAHEKGYAADLKVAATAPEALVSVKTNAPVVALTKAPTEEPTKAKGDKKKAPATKVNGKPASAKITKLPTYEELKAAGDKVTSELVAEAQAEAKAAETTAADATAKVDAVTTKTDALATEVLAGAKAMAPAATEALKNKKAWVEAYAKADAADLNKKAKALETALAAYEKAEKPSAEDATSFVTSYVAYLKSSTALKASHDALVAAEVAAAEAAAAQAAAEAAAAEAAAQQQWVDPGYTDWGSNGGSGSWGNAGAGGGSNGGSGGGSNGGSGGGSNGGAGAGSGGWVTQPCEATGTCEKPNI